MDRSIRRGLIAATLALGIGFALWRGAGDTKELLQWIVSRAEEPWALPTYFAAACIATSVFIPSGAFSATAAAAWGMWPGVLWAYLAFTIASHLHFWAGRTFAREAVLALLERRGLARRVGGVIAEHGVLGVVMLRALPLPFVVANMGAGALPISYRDFVIGNALGGAPHVFAYASIGSALLAGLQGAPEEALLRALIGVAIVVVATALPTLIRRLRRPKD